MPTIATQLSIPLKAAIRAAFGVDSDPLLGVSQNEKFGDYQSNVAMGLAKTVGQNPRAVAERIRSELNLGGMAEEVTIAGPGFINIRLSPQWLAEELARRTDVRLGIEKIAHPQRVVVDYSGPNVAKEMHVGHLRSTIIGDAISRVLDFRGNDVIRQNHVGDWGTQFGMLIGYLVLVSLKQGETDWDVLIRKWKDIEKSSGHVSLEEKSLIGDLEDFYRKAKQVFDSSEDFRNFARTLVVKLQRGDEPSVRELWQDIVDETRRHYEPLYERLGVKLKRSDERAESAYNSDLPIVVADLKRLGLAVESAGATAVFIDGSDKTPLIVEKTDGGYPYSTTDLAAIRYRIRQLHAQRIIYTHDSRQAQHFAQVFATAKKAGWAEGVSLEFAPFGTMLGEDGKPFKTRTGGTVKLKDLLDEAEERALAVVTEKNPELPEQRKRQIATAVGIGGIKYADLSKDRISDYVFSFDRMLALDGNTAPYIQYAHARIKSIFRKAGGAAPGKITLSHPMELALAKHILRLDEIIEIVDRELKPHHLCTFLYDLAAKFSAFFENCPVIQSPDPLRASRLALCDLAARTLEVGMDLLGIQHPDQM
ncbi:MAG TPA: arginine--tRNA ligase [Tepidisphaeraceae bacterium]|nr:arginine--tRNA ligase [Tepidisphaeraceae bacterium]